MLRIYDESVHHKLNEEKLHWVALRYLIVKVLNLLSFVPNLVFHQFSKWWEEAVFYTPSSDRKLRTFQLSTSKEELRKLLQLRNLLRRRKNSETFHNSGTFFALEFPIHFEETTKEELRTFLTSTLKELRITLKLLQHRTCYIFRKKVERRTLQLSAKLLTSEEPTKQELWNFLTFQKIVKLLHTDSTFSSFSKATGFRYRTPPNG